MNLEEKHRSIVVINRGDEAIMRQDRDGSKLLTDETVAIVRLPLRIDGIDKELQRLHKNSLLDQGSFLVRSPYEDSRFVSITEATEEFAVRRMQIFQIFCKHLGARTVTVKMFRQRDSNGSVLAESDMSVAGTIKHTGKYSSNTYTRIVSNFNATNVHIGTEIDIDAAEKLIVENGLEGDPMFETWLALRRGGNPINDGEWTVSLSRETRRVMEHFHKTKIPFHLIKINPSLKLQADANYNYEVSVKVTFNESL